MTDQAHFGNTFQARSGAKDVSPSKRHLLERERPDGRLVRAVCTPDGSIDGPRSEWSPDGILLSMGWYKSGYANGLFRWWHSSGQLRGIRFVSAGLREGADIEFDQDGNLLECRCFRSGIPSGVWVRKTPEGFQAIDYSWVHKRVIELLEQGLSPGEVPDHLEMDLTEGQRKQVQRGCLRLLTIESSDQLGWRDSLGAPKTSLDELE
jgi:antitoxin component YwqK of YwqJK toxin-antitoxin module